MTKNGDSFLDYRKIIHKNMPKGLIISTAISFKPTYVMD